MAGNDVYVNEDREADKLAAAPYVNGARTITMIETEEFIISDGSSTSDKYRFFAGINPNLIPIDIKVYADDALVGATDVDIGLYLNGAGLDVVDEDVFADGIDLSPAGGLLRGGGIIGTDEYLDGLKAVDIANLTNKIYEHAGHTIKNHKAGYDLVLTVKSDVTTGGTVTVIAQFIEG